MTRACAWYIPQRTGAWCAALVLVLAGCTTGSRSPGQGSSTFTALCADIDNSYECAQAIERHQLRESANAGRVARRGGALHVQLQDGRSVTVADTSPDEESAAKYSFREYLSEIGYFLLHRQLYEGEEYVMLHHRTGQMFAVPNVPVISPDGARVVTTFPGLSGGYSPNAVQIWLLAPDGLVEEYAIHPRDWEPTGATWVDGSTIRLETRTHAPGGDEIRLQSMELKLRDGKWIIPSVP